MRIVFLQRSPNFSGGCRVIAQYAVALRNAGHEVLVVSSREPRPKPLRQLLNKVRGVHHPPADGKSWLDDLEIEHRRVVGEIRPADVPDGDVVVATWWETAEWAARLPSSCGAAAYFLQGVEWTIDGAPASRVRQTWRLPLHKIVIAEFMRNIAQEDFGDSDVSFVPNSVDPSMYFPPKDSARREGLLFLHAGKTRVKGWDVAEAALHRIHEAHPDLPIRGFGRHTPQLPHWIEFFESPPQEQIRQLYQSAQLFLHCSRAEGFGLPLLEAMACGTPVVGTEAGAAPELVERGGGVMVPFGEGARTLDRALSASAAAFAPRMAAATTAVLSDKSGFADRSKRALEVAKAHSPKASAEHFEAALVRAVEKKQLRIQVPANAEFAQGAMPSEVEFKKAESSLLFWHATRSAGELKHPLVALQVEELVAHAQVWSKLRRAAGAGISRSLLRSSVASSSGRGPRLLFGPLTPVERHPTTLLLRSTDPPLIRRFALFFAKSSTALIELWDGSLDTREQITVTPRAGVLVPAHPSLLVSSEAPELIDVLDFYEADLEAEHPSFETRRRLPHPDATLVEKTRVARGIALEEGERAVARVRDFVRNRFFGFE